MPFWRRVVDLMLLRAGPQDMPGDQASLVAVAVAYAAVGVVQVAMLESFGRAALLALLTTILLGIYTAGLLTFRQFPHRFHQTAIALFATGTVFTVLMLGPDYAITPYLESLRQPPTATQATKRPSNTAAKTPDHRSHKSSPDAPSPPGSGLDAVAPPAILVLLFIVTGLWRLMVYAQIFRNALEVSRWIGLAASIGFEVFLIIVFSLI